MKDLIQIHYDNADRPTVSGRELHEALGVETRYNDWFDRMCEYGFSAGKDYYSFLSNRSDGKAGKPRTDHQLTIPMAKELCMLQRTDKGKQMQQYFIAVEEQWNSPDAIMARALQLSNAKLKEMQITVSALTVENPDHEAETRSTSTNWLTGNLLTGIRENRRRTGREAEPVRGVPAGKRKYMYRDKKGKLTAYAKPLSDGLFERKECVNEKSPVERHAGPCHTQGQGNRSGC